jgi:transcriptional regulator with XRE-family HTH domain
MDGEKMRERLVRAREFIGYNRKAFADALGMSYRTVTNYENGSREPGHDYLIKVADFCGCTTDWLLGLSDDPRNNAPHESEEDLLKKRLLLACDALNSAAVEKVITYADDLAYNPYNRKPSNG